MRLHVLLLVAALLGVVGGAVLIGWWAVGLAIIADSMAVAWYALFHDDGQPAEPEVSGMPTVEQIFDRARRAP